MTPDELNAHREMVKQAMQTRPDPKDLEDEMEMWKKILLRPPKKG